VAFLVEVLCGVMASGISKTGKQVEAEYRRITGATKPARATLGDAVVDGWNIEVKKASSNTLNQVRAVKFIPLAVKDTRSNQWYVVPAPDIVRLVAEKKRGQHTENPFESSTLSLASLGAFRVKKSELLSKTRQAITKGKRHPKLRAEMARILKESRALADESRKRVSKLLK
jgi:hypothetical protein